MGVAFPVMKLDGPGFSDDGNRTHIGVSPMFGLMAGFSHKLDDSFVLDVRYRFAGTYGSTQEREIGYVYYFKNKIGMILDNSISVGVRYEF